MVKPMMIDLGYDLNDVGAILGTGGSLAALLGAVVGGVLLSAKGRDARGRGRVLLAFGVLRALTVALYAFPAEGVGGYGLLYAVCAIEHFTGSMATAALFTVMMDACRPERPATDYTLQASLVVVSAGLASSLSGFVARAAGFAGHFGLTAALSLLGLLGVAALLRRARPRLEGPPLLDSHGGAS